MNPSLLQGLTYVNRDKYNPKIVTKEWFDNMQNTEKCSSSDIQKNIQSLISEYKTKADEIKSLEEQYKKQTDNLYLNKNVQFSDGTYAYVTKAGIVKKYANLAMLQKNANLNGCPPPAFLNVAVPWSSAYDVPGASIQMPSTLDATKGPILKTGSPMVAGQSCGFEGTDVMVTQENDTPISRYIGCYDYKEGQMSYLNNNEPYQNFIANPGFSNPWKIRNTLTNQTLTPTNNLLDNWTTASSATIVNANNTNKVASSSNLVYPTPYPNSSICVSLNGTQDIRQVINTSLTGGKYKLSFSACGYSSSNPINILVNNVSIFVGSSYLVPTYAWQTYSYTIKLPTSTNLTLSFQGTDTVSGSSKYSAITNIRLTNGTPTSSPMFSFESCQNIAKASPSAFPYFGFQAASGRTDGMGFCSVNSDTTGSFLSNLSPASQLGPQKILSSGTTTAPNIGVSAGLTKTGLLVVYTSSVKSNYVQVSTNAGLPPNTLNKPYLLLSDDGIMRIYANGDPLLSKPGELLWSSIAPSVPVFQNLDYEASKGATGKNYLIPSNTLMPGQFIGSPNGSCYLKMETTGDLVLYTSTYASGCQRNTKNSSIMEGTLNSLAIYKVNTATDNLFTNLGKLFFVSPDSKLQTFETDKLKMSTTYQKIANYNNPGTSFNLTGDMSSFNSLDKCKAACDSNTNCFGYSFTSSSNSCQLKGSNLNADVGSVPVPGTDLYVRQQERTSNSLTANHVGSTRKQNYVPGSAYKPEDYPNASTAVEAKKQELAAIEDKISEAVEQLQQCGSSSSHSQQMNEILKQIQVVKGNVQNKRSDATSGKTVNLDRMVEDTSFRVSQDSDKYLMWGLLGAATILFSVGVSKL